MNDLPYWGIAAIQLWICTRDLWYVQRRLTGNAQRDEEHVCDVLAQFELEPLNLEAAELPEGYEKEKRPLVVSTRQANEELLARLRSGELKAQGVKCDPFNEGKAVSDTVQDIPACDWGYLKFGPFPNSLGGRYAAFYEHNDCPSWRHIVCPGVTAQQLWPALDEIKPFADRLRAAFAFLDGWQVRTDTINPYHGAQTAAFKDVAAKFKISPDAVKKSVGGLVADEIERRRKAMGKAT
jgi:hypothetical protein